MTHKMREAAPIDDPLKRTVILNLSKFAFEALAEIDRPGSVDASAKMEGAIRLYLEDRPRARAAWPYPAFLRGTEAKGDVELELSTDEDLWLSFEEEAGKQDVSVPQLAEHAAFYLAAEVNAGRIIHRMLDDFAPAEAEDGEA